MWSNGNSFGDEENEPLIWQYATRGWQ